MSFDNLPASKPAPRRPKTAPVFCVGWRAFVNWPASAAPHGMPVPLTDAAGQPLANDLGDGQPVEIVAWNPRSRDGVLYRVRRIADRTEWWIEARYLRREAIANASSPSAAASTPHR